MDNWSSVTEIFYILVLIKYIFKSTKEFFLQNFKTVFYYWNKKKLIDYLNKPNNLNPIAKKYLSSIFYRCLGEGLQTPFITLVN